MTDKVLQVSDKPISFFFGYYYRQKINIAFPIPGASVLFCARWAGKSREKSLFFIASSVLEATALHQKVGATSLRAADTQGLYALFCSPHGAGYETGRTNIPGTSVRVRGGVCKARPAAALLRAAS